MVYFNPYIPSSDGQDLINHCDGWLSVFCKLRIPLSNRLIWAARICASRSVVDVRFRTPFAILPLMKGGGGVRNWTRKSWTTEIKELRSTVKIGFRTPLAILPLMKGGGVRNGVISRGSP
jgi:hypothetical protein